MGSVLYVLVPHMVAHKIPLGSPLGFNTRCAISDFPLFEDLSRYMKNLREEFNEIKLGCV